MSDRLTRAVDGWIFDAFRPGTRDLPLFRILYAAVLLLCFTPGLRWIGGFPDSFYDPPPGPMLLFGGFPPPAAFTLLHFATVFSALCLLVGYRTRVASLATGVLLMAGNGWLYSFGKINHDILLIVPPLVLSASGWGRRYSLDAARRDTSAGDDPAWPLALLALLVGLGMFSSGFQKLASGWLDPSVPATLGHLIYNHYIVEQHTVLSAYLLSAGLSPLVWKGLDYATVALELGFVAAALRPGWMRMACALACLFHLGVYLMMDIVFTPSIMAYGAFVGWSALLPEGVRRGLAGRTRGWTPRPATVLAAGVLLAAGYAWAGDPSGGVQRAVTGRDVLNPALVLFAAALSCGWVARSLARARRAPRSAPEAHPPGTRP